MWRDFDYSCLSLFLEKELKMKKKNLFEKLSYVPQIMANTHSLPPPIVEPSASTGLSGEDVVKRLEERLSQEGNLREQLQQKLHDLEGVLQNERQEKNLVVEELRDLQNKLANEEAPQ